ncbi:MAG: NAD(P)H-hydrate dehydratase, partial [Ignavibacteriales bacterium]|nr:NAD(P)H-hydrate dehydratase [Ignavibacteriales bacterium]
SADGFSIPGGLMLTMLDAPAMRRLDVRAVRQYAIPSMILMENAGRCVVDVAASKLDGLEGKRILVIAGKGNNGGDGFVAARHAAHRGALVDVLVTAEPDVLRGDALQAYEMLACAAHPSVHLLSLSHFASVRRRSYDSIVDALFGTSFHGEVRGVLRSIIRWMNASPALVIAVDIPSGLDATDGMPAADAVKADVTVAMAALKPGILLGSGREYCGEVLVADIHIPEELILSVGGGMYAVEAQDVAALLPQRPATAHKYQNGKVFIIAGSRGLTGAALLASSAAVRTGAGAVVLGVPASEMNVVARRTLEVMPMSLASTPEGSLTRAAIESACEKMKWADAVLVGPGLGRNDETMHLARDLVLSAACPLVLDADGLFAFVGKTALFKKRKTRSLILTPHFGEFARLLQVEAGALERSACNRARLFAKQHRLILVLKGPTTIVACPDGTLYMNTTGNAGMATAGSGDVLGGTIVTFLAQGVEPEWAAVMGVFLHGRAGDIARDHCGERSMAARDLIKYLPDAIRTLDAECEC